MSCKNLPKLTNKPKQKRNPEDVNHPKITKKKIETVIKNISRNEVSGQALLVSSTKYLREKKVTQSFILHPLREQKKINHSGTQFIRLADPSLKAC